MNAFEDYLFAKVDAIPEIDLPPVLFRLIEMLERPGAQIEDFVGEISQDPDVINLVAHDVSRAAFRKAKDLTDGILAIGMPKFKAIISTLAQGDGQAFRTPDLEILQGKQLRHAQLVGTCSQLIAAELGYRNFALAYLAGYLHDFGSVVATAFPRPKISDALKLTQAKAMALHSAEDRSLGINHTYVGARILRRWKLPESLIDPVQFHHNPQEAKTFPWIVKIVHLADVAVDCHEARLPIGISLFPIDAGTLAGMPFDKDDLMEMARESAKQLDS